MGSLGASAPLGGVGGVGVRMIARRPYILYISP